MTDLNDECKLCRKFPAFPISSIALQQHPNRNSEAPNFIRYPIRGITSK